MLKHSFQKDPDEVLDFTFNWSDVLDGDEIVTSSWTRDSGDATIASQTNTVSTATVWLSGGTDTTDTLVRNRITTNGGRTYEETLRVQVRSR